MKLKDHRFPPDRIAFKPATAAVARRASRHLDYRAWREDEIVRLELTITRSLMSRSRLLRIHRTVHVETMLYENERRLLRLGSALAALTSVPFTLAEVLTAAATAPRFSVA